MSSHDESDPWAAPAGTLSDDDTMFSGVRNEGSYVAGFLVGFLCGCIGLIVVLVSNPGERTKQGALAGFGVGFVLGLLVNLLEIGMNP